MRSKFQLVFVVALILQMVILPLNFVAANATSGDGGTTAPSIDYLALGDSLAAGITPEGKEGSGYPDYLAESIAAFDELNSFNKGFAHSGYTTLDVLNDIENIAQLRELIEQANVVTLSVGANDVLKHVEIDAKTGEVIVDLEELSKAFGQVTTNLQTIMEKVNQINPEAYVFVMEYYNPFPYLDQSQQPQLQQLLQLLNGAIEKGIKETGAVLVSTSAVIEENYQTYLPNPTNIHLSEDGYKKVADQFWEQFQHTYPWSHTPQIEFTDIREHWAENLIKQAVIKKLVNGYPDGTFRPNQSITRAEFTKILMQALDDEEAESSLAFSDNETIPNWAEEEVVSAVTLGIIQGYSDDTFRPYQKVTRAEMAVMIARALKLATNSTSTSFADDADIPTWAKGAVEAVKEIEIIEGRGGNSFIPNETAKRAEAATMLLRMIEKAK